MKIGVTKLESWAKPSRLVFSLGELENQKLYRRLKQSCFEDEFRFNIFNFCTSKPTSKFGLKKCWYTSGRHPEGNTLMTGSSPACVSV